MKIKKELIGSKVFHTILNKYIDIEEGNEELYQKLGMDVFEQKEKPRLQKKTRKKDDKNIKGRDNNDNSNVDGVSYDK